MEVIKCTGICSKYKKLWPPYAYASLSLLLFTPPSCVRCIHASPPCSHTHAHTHTYTLLSFSGEIVNCGHSAIKPGGRGASNAGYGTLQRVLCAGMAACALHVLQVSGVGRVFVLQTIIVFMALCSKHASMAACALHVFASEWVVCLLCKPSLF